MKPTEKYASIAGCLGIAAGLATAFWLLPGAVWWAHVVIGVVVAAGLYQGMVQQKGAENLADMDPHSDRDARE